jgi:5-methylcytosine-specific restriction protein A
MPRTLTVCPTPGCPTLTTGGRCGPCDRTADRARGTATQRGYTGRGHRSFRRGVLRKHPVCVWPEGCDQPATDADHWPHDRRTLIARGLNPNDPRHGRGLCSTHHKQATAQHQPGGWNQR